MSNQRVGKLGEAFVSDLLIKKGYAILSRNYRYSRFSEIDVVASKFNKIYFIEVKTREQFSLKEQYKSVNDFKVFKIKKGVSKFLKTFPKYYDYQWKIIVALLLINPYTKAKKVVFYDYLN